MAFVYNAAAGALFLGKVFNTGIGLVESSAAAGYPALNVIDWRYPRRTWRSTTTAAQTLTFDFGASPPSHVGIYLRGTNFITATLMANPTNTWGAPAISKALTIPLDAFLSRYHTMVFWNTTRTVVTHRYVQLAIPNQTTTDGASYFSLGTMLPVVTPVEVELRAPLQITRRQAMLKNDLPTRREVQRLGDRQLVLNLPWNYAWDQVLDSSNNETDLMIALAVSEDEPVIVCWNAQKPELGFLARREGDVDLQSQDGIGASMALSFAEIM